MDHIGYIPLDENTFLIFNRWNGEVDIVDQKALEFLLNKTYELKEISPKDKKLREYFKLRGYLNQFDKEVMFRRAQKRLESYRSQINNFPMHCFIPTYDCNLRCHYCYQRYLWTKPHPEFPNRKFPNDIMKISQVDAAFRVIDKYEETVDPTIEQNPPKLISGSDLRPREINFFGGEPFQKKTFEIVKYILQQGIDRNYSFKGTTNAVELDLFLPLIEKYHINHFQVSLDGIAEIHDKRRPAVSGDGTFHQTVQNIERLLELDEIFIEISTSIDEKNIKTFNSFKNFLIEKGWWKGNPKIRINVGFVFERECIPYTHTVNREDFASHLLNAEDNDELLKFFFDIFRPNNYLERILSGENVSFKPKYWFCSAQGPMFFYDQYGYIYPCFDILGNEKYAIGKYFPENVMFKEELVKWRNRTVLNIPECRECKYAFFCGGGCTYFALRNNNDGFKPECSTFERCKTMILPLLYRKRKKELRPNK